MTDELWKHKITWQNQRPEGTLRHNQIITSFGPGALVDFAGDAAIVAGLSWWAKGEEIVEDRLLAMLAKEERFRNVKLHEPPTSRLPLHDPARSWIKAFKFPQWFVCQDENCWQNAGLPPRRDGAKPRQIVHDSALDHKCAPGKDKKPHILPVRFLRACRLGHTDDLDWGALAHSEVKYASSCRRSCLWIDEIAPTGDLNDVRLSCSWCGEGIYLSRLLRDAGYCSGKRPWLGYEDRGQICHLPTRLFLRSAPNAYFPVTASVLHLPKRDEAMREKVASVYETIKNAPDAATVGLLRQLVDAVRAALEGLTDADVFSEIERQRRGSSGQRKKTKEAELDVFLAGDERNRDDKFVLKNFPLPQKSALSKIGKVVLLPRLTEVRALCGFTRFEPHPTNMDGELELTDEVARLDEPLSWLPAVENPGEGFFFSLDEKAIQGWLDKKPAVTARVALFKTAFEQWQNQSENRKSAKDDFANARYVLLHSLSHLLMTAISLECGYPSGSIRERIYMGASNSGILLHTTSPGAEGSLGGLVEVGRNLDKYLRIALDFARLCPNDPMCAAHLPGHEIDPGHGHLEGASCLGCLVISESSCERVNTYLDRTLVVETLESSGAAFFDDRS